MDSSNSIFTGSSRNGAASLYRLNNYSLDNGQMNFGEERNFNTYRYWIPYYAPLEDVIDGQKGDEPDMKQVSAVHTKALFSRNNGIPVYDEYRVDANMPLLDNPDSRKRQRKNNSCTIKDLVEASAKGEMGAQTYSYADFAYCKYLGKVSNNYLITLRRFASPCGDHIDLHNSMKGYRGEEKKIQHHLDDVGRMVTWLGTPGNEMSNILKYSYKMKWTTQSGEVDDVQNVGEGKGPLAGIFNLASSNYRKEVMQGRAGTNFVGSNAMNKLLGGGDNFGSPPYPKAEFERMRNKNKAYGPVDSINQVTRRDVGLEFEHKITLTFDYELRSYYGVNGKAAMMDLLGNILACTYAHGIFWGGAHRFYGSAQDETYTNLPIFKLAEQGRLNDPGAVLDATIASITEGAKAFTSGVQGESTMDKIKNAAKDLGGMLLGGLLNKMGRPQKQAVAALLEKKQTGCWHLTVGNPKSPIIEVGNLICEGVEVEHYGPLGLDDFPTGLRVKVSLSHGMPRDTVGIEKMYGRGESRIYTPLGDKVLKQYEGSSKVGGANDTDSSSSQQNSVEQINKKIADMASSDSMFLEGGSKQTLTSKDLEYASMGESLDFNNIKFHFGIPIESQIITASEEAFFGASDPPKSEKA